MCGENVLYCSTVGNYQIRIVPQHGLYHDMFWKVFQRTLNAIQVILS